MANETALFESAQALFCSIADGLGIAKSKEILNIKKYPTFALFQLKQQKLIDKSFKATDVDVSPNDIYNFLGGFDPKKKIKIDLSKPSKKGLSWYQSSIAIANAIVSQLHNKVDPQFSIKGSGYQDGSGFHWFRGDQEVSKTISALFGIANRSEATKTATWGDINIKSSFYGYNDPNKWNPADIYYANKIAKSALKNELARATALKQNYTFDGGRLKLTKGRTIEKAAGADGLNIVIARLIDAGALLPLSLKKVSTDKVTLKKVNFSISKKLKLLNSVEFSGIHRLGWKKFKRLDKSSPPVKTFSDTKGRTSLNNSWKEWLAGKVTNTRDMRITIDTDAGVGDIKFRHDPSGPRFVTELIYGGAKAKAGSIASWEDLGTIWKSIDPVAGTGFLKKFSTADSKFREEKKKLESSKTALRKNIDPRDSRVSEYDHYMGILSGEIITNVAIKLIKEWFEKSGNTTAKDKFCMLLFQVITSRAPLSSRFVIAK